jgi:putative transposase
MIGSSLNLLRFIRPTPFAGPTLPKSEGNCGAQTTCIPHHATQRGNGCQQTFFSNDDDAFYRNLLRQYCAEHGVAIWGWVLMPNHVHLILVPETEDSLRAALSKVHRAYAGHIHAREKRTGHFWQGRFGCVAMDEAHLAAAVAYVVLNPVRARLVRQASDWHWSSVHAHLKPDKGDGMTETAPVAERFPDFVQLIRAGEDDALSGALRRAETIGRPVGGEAFMALIAASTGHDPRPAKRGRKAKALPK